MKDPTVRWSVDWETQGQEWVYRGGTDKQKYHKFLPGHWPARCRAAACRSTRALSSPPYRNSAPPASGRSGQGGSRPRAGGGGGLLVTAGSGAGAGGRDRADGPDLKSGVSVAAVAPKGDTGRRGTSPGGVWSGARETVPGPGRAETLAKRPENTLLRWV